ncbi:MAG TPA: UDP-N-acetylmuramoyl-L-alanine--D-glutamate ligase [Burkholderiales bacterium]|nr:UDP-N-acetylmuramoyl-L-alanine--D-glutamate ligase [Burkholderiales bacterium]
MNYDTTFVKGKKALVLGLGESGLSMAQWLSRHGARVRVADSRATPPGMDDLRKAVPMIELSTGAFKDDLLDQIDFIALSPGLSPEEPVVKAGRARGLEVVGDIELFARALPKVHKPIVIAITGTNGKTTVTALTAAMCAVAGKDTIAAGNISPAVLNALMQCEDERRSPDVWVLELSSFQLETTASLHPTAAAMLNLSEDHLDRHADMPAYAEAKARIFYGGGAQVLNRDDPYSRGMQMPGQRAFSFGLGPALSNEDYGLLSIKGEYWLAQGMTPLLPVSEMKLEGLHNAANALAALALARAVGLPLAPCLDALKHFGGLPHRVERAGEIDGVVFYDDSKGTNVGSTVAALNGFARQFAHTGKRVVLIAGGEGKAQNFEPLAPAVHASARAVVLMGRDASLIEEALAESGVPCYRAADMHEAVRIARGIALPGDAVLLSPACASFDMFRNYKHRGDVFVAAVKALTHATH